MHAAGLARANYGPGDLARKRTELLYEVTRRLSIEERKRCTVVFDAIDAPRHRTNRFRREEMLVLFAEPGHEADELIELLIAQHSSPRQLKIISSDHRLQTAVRRRRGAAIDSEQFLKRPILTDRPIKMPKGPQDKTSNHSNSELRFWMAEFGEIDPASIQTELQEESAETRSDWDRQVEDLQKRLNDPDKLDEWLGQP